MVQKKRSTTNYHACCSFFYFLLASLSFIGKTSKSIFLRVFVALWFKKNAQPQIIMLVAVFFLLSAGVAFLL
ncbi:hypothetical protein, partial [Fischerella thermalis]|uniref:hypothetical protein n=1 Tax=Fischerella thermalis TaxID=372787 RepID=UPI001CA4C15D